MTVTWPAERFYWAQLEAPGLNRPGELPPGLRAAFEDQVPEPDADLHIVFVPIEGGRILACGAPGSELDAAGALRLTPSEVPAWGGARADDLNLLVGRMEPRPIRRARARRHLATMAVLAACATIVCVGLVRRSRHWQDQAARSSTVARGAIDSALPGVTPEKLAAEVQRARRSVGSKAPPPWDASETLASLLRVWPTSVPSKPLSIAILPESVALSVNIEGDSAPFLEALAAPSGWVLGEPRLTSTGSLTRLTLAMRREPGGQR